MATQQQNISSALLRLVQAINTLKGYTGNLSELTTTDKTSLVASLNEVKASIPTLNSLIDDSASSVSKTWSSNKIQSQITAAIQAILSGADSSNDTLKELADRITAVAQADAGMISFAAVQTLTTEQKSQACNNLGIGDPSFDYVTGITSALASEL